jgi:dihydrofolate synthase/folylpolyglutamate synthase
MIASYEDAMEYLYRSLPVFHRIGKVALKPNLNNTLTLCSYLGNPQTKFKSIHVGGTNGKGSSSHFLASIFQEAGYKTGLYTSPHLKDFRERIKIDGEMVSTMYVVDFVNKHRKEIERVSPSFFEVTVAIAFDFFAKEQVDIAIIEVGLGGRLDSTNVITPEISLITNISNDHADILGDTLDKIAFEKAGIIKHHIPAVISERQEEVAQVFIKKAQQEEAALFFASDEYILEEKGRGAGWMMIDIKKDGELKYPALKSGLSGSYQLKNLAGVFKTVDLALENGFVLNPDHIQHGIANVIENTGLKGRWQALSNQPMIVCDTGHNEGGIREILEMIGHYTFNQLHIVLGMVRDKEIEKILDLLPSNAIYYFCQANIPRALEADLLSERAAHHGLKGHIIIDVNDAIAAAKKAADASDFIFIGGSTFVVAEINEL